MKSLIVFLVLLVCPQLSLAAVDAWRMNQFTGKPDYYQAGIDSAIVTDIAASTTALALQGNALSVSTAALAVQTDALSVSTAANAARITSLESSTSTLEGRVDALEISTATLDAALTSIPDGALSSNVALKNIDNQFSVPQTIEQKYGVWIDSKTVGTDGGTPTANSWTARTLNTEVVDIGNIGSLSSDVVALQAGTYLCEWWSPFARAGRVATRLSVGSTAYAGMSVWDNNIGGYATSVSHGIARFTIAEETNISVVYYVENANATTGLGYAGPSGRTGIGAYEVYTILKCTKEQ